MSHVAPHWWFRSRQNEKKKEGNETLVWKWKYSTCSVHFLKKRHYKSTVTAILQNQRFNRFGMIRVNFFFHLSVQASKRKKKKQDIQTNFHV